VAGFHATRPQKGTESLQLDYGRAVVARSTPSKNNATFANEKEYCPLFVAVGGRYLCLRSVGFIEFPICDRGGFCEVCDEIGQ